MNYLQQLIKLRGLDCQDIATAIGYGYHSVQKNIKGHRRNTTIRNAIADYLQLDPAKVWGKGAIIYLRRMVAIEANRAADRRAKAARDSFLMKFGGIVPAKSKAVNV